MLEYIANRSKLEHRNIIKGREGLGLKLREVTKAGKVFAKAAKTSGKHIKRGIR